MRGRSQQSLYENRRRDVRVVHAATLRQNQHQFQAVENAWNAASDTWLLIRGRLDLSRRRTRSSIEFDNGLRS